MFENNKLIEKKKYQITETESNVYIKQNVK